MINPESKNAVGKPVGYRIVTGENTVLDQNLGLDVLPTEKGEGSCHA